MKNIVIPNALLNVLCLEDVLKDAELLNEMLENAGYLVRMDIAEGEVEYVDFLKGKNYDVILSDNSLPNFDAFAALKLAITLKPEIPFVCVSGTIGEEKAVELLKQGAADYVLKDRLGRLATSVQRALKVAELQKERKQSEEALQHSYIFSETLLKTIPFGMHIVDEKGTILFQNDNFKKIFGESSVGRKCWELYRDDKKQCSDCPLFTGIILGETETYESHGVFGGRIFEISHTGMIFQGKEAMLEIFQDITERNKKEAELIRAKENAEESDRLKSAFLTNMSHEIRTPMNGILGFSDLLKKPDLTGEQQQQYLEIIGQSGKRMLDTINSIIDISKIEAGLETINVSELNVTHHTKSLYEFFKPMAEVKGLHFSLSNGLLSHAASIKTDSGKFSSVLTNLVGNAFKFTEKGSIEFGYKNKGKYLEFFVKDTGIGIPKDRLDAIFERFVQADIEDKRVFQGSGLGLTISKSYVEMLGGKMWVESQEGKGSSFYFTLPRTIESNGKKIIDSVASEKDKEVKPNPEISGLKILVAEDDEVSFTLLTDALDEICSEVIRAITGKEAISICYNNPDIDLILMDIKMPDMNGYEATAEIRKFNKEVVVIAQTAYGLAGDREKALDAGCNDYICKPVELDLLTELIKKHCNK